jgi:hypothetical protein
MRRTLDVAVASRSPRFVAVDRSEAVARGNRKRGPENKSIDVIVTSTADNLLSAHALKGKRKV